MFSLLAKRFYIIKQLSKPLCLSVFILNFLYTQMQANSVIMLTLSVAIVCFALMASIGEINILFTIVHALNDINQFK